MDEDFYVSISFDKIEGYRVDQILQAIQDIRGTKVGMTVHYDDPITGDENDDGAYRDAAPIHQQVSDQY